MSDAMGQAHRPAGAPSLFPTESSHTPVRFPSARAITALSVAGIGAHLVLRYTSSFEPFASVPLYAVLALGGLPLVYGLTVKALKQEFGSDLLAGISIVASALLDEYLAGALVVLMLSGGTALEEYASAHASSALRALAARLPSIAHRRSVSGTMDIGLDQLAVGDELVIFPHEICPVDGQVIDGRGVMDESYLTGEPYMMSKTAGSSVLSGAVNGDNALTIRTGRLPRDSRYAKIMEVMKEAQQRRPHLRRLGDQLGAAYSPIAVALALAAWFISGDSIRFLAVLVVATPCPLLIAIPVAIIGTISLAAKRGIIIKDPAALEQLDQCRTLILDKTGTLTYGEPALTAEWYAPGFARAETLPAVAAVERYSKHPLATAITRAVDEAHLTQPAVEEIRERPGDGIQGIVAGRRIEITGRDSLPGALLASLPPRAAGLECIVRIDGQLAAAFQFHDAPRGESRAFVEHLAPKHHLDRILIVSGDQEAEVRYLAAQVSIAEVYAGISPEGKVDIVRRETARAKTLFVGDGINDAPALTTATVGVAFGKNSDVATEAASVVVIDTSLAKVDELLHISRRLRRIALQSAVGGMALSIVGMIAAAAGYLPPVAGAIAQELIDLLAVFNALRAAIPPRQVSDL